MATNRNIYFALFTTAVIFALGFGHFAHAQSIGVTLPSVPTGVTAARASQPSQISVSWSASAESSGTIAGYYVYRNGVEITTTGGTSIIDANLGSGLYQYTVAAYDTNGNMSARSSPASITFVLDTTPPTVPTGVTITGVTSTKTSNIPTTLTISWNPSSDNVAVAGYYVYRNGISITTSTSNALTGTSITDTVTAGTYTYTVVAYDASQNFSDQSSPATIIVSVDTTSPTLPTNVLVQQTSATGVSLSWASSTDSAGMAGYQIFRNGVQIASATGSPYADSGLSTGATYSYTVTAYDIPGNFSNPSSPATVTMQIANGPGAPYALSATLSGTSTIALSWAPSVDALVISNYSLYRNGAQIATVTSTRYLDTGLAAGSYAYNVEATDVSGAVSSLSASSSIVFVPTYNPAASVIAPAPVVPPAVIPTPSPTSAVSTPASAPISATLPPSSATPLSQFLFFGLRSSQVQVLQSLLVQGGYLSPTNETGFFGSLTRSAVEKYQCDQNIVCTGGAGWGLVGPKTRNSLNTSLGNAAVISTPPSSALSTELQTLEAELASLEEQAQK